MPWPMAMTSNRRVPWLKPPCQPSCGLNAGLASANSLPLPPDAPSSDALWRTSGTGSLPASPLWNLGTRLLPRSRRYSRASMPRMCATSYPSAILWTAPNSHSMGHWRQLSALAAEQLLSALRAVWHSMRERIRGADSFFALRPPNQRMHQSGRGRRVSQGWHGRSASGRFLERAAAPQVMRGR